MCTVYTYLAGLGLLLAAGSAEISSHVHMHASKLVSHSSDLENCSQRRTQKKKGPKTEDRRQKTARR